MSHSSIFATGTEKPVTNVTTLGGEELYAFLPTVTKTPVTEFTKGETPWERTSATLVTVLKPGKSQ
jgi:hypothetical protein